MSITTGMTPKYTNYGDLIWRGWIIRSVRKGKRLVPIYGYAVVGSDNSDLPITVQPNNSGSWDAIIQGEVITSCRYKSDAQAAIYFALQGKG